MNLKARLAVLGAVGVLSIALVLSATIISGKQTYIKNLGGGTTSTGQLANSVSVTGDGKVYAKPDMAQLSVTISELASTSSEALEEVNQKVARIMQILQSKGIPQDDTQTSQLSIYPEYDYSAFIYRLKGQRATVSLTVKIRGIDATASKATDIIDDVAQVENVQLGSIAFDIDNKAALFTQARELAFNKAKQKAEELATLGGVKIVTPLTITDSSYDAQPPTPLYNYREAAVPTADSSSGTQISTGQLEINAQVSVTFAIE